MPRTLLRSAALAGTIAILGLTAGCARIRDHKGYVVDSTLIGTVAPGIDNRDSVQKTLGRPSFAVERTGMEKIAHVVPFGDKTPTLGSKRGFFRELFGNIGRVGSVGQSGGTADNPTGGGE